MSSPLPVKVLFVCLGNICRSPTAEAVFRHCVTQAGLQQMIHIDSAGTGDWHVGKPPDARALQAAALRGYDLAQLRGRQVCENDLYQFDYILAMDQDNLQDILTFRPKKPHGHIGLFLDFAENAQHNEVPDPFYGGNKGFERVLDLIENAARGLLEDIQKKRF